MNRGCGFTRRCRREGSQLNAHKLAEARGLIELGQPLAVVSEPACRSTPCGQPIKRRCPRLPPGSLLNTELKRDLNA